MNPVGFVGEIKIVYGGHQERMGCEDKESNFVHNL